MKNANRPLVRPADIVIILLVISLSLYFLIKPMADDSSLVAVISVNGEVIRRIDLKTAEDETIILETTPEVTLQVKDGKICFIDSLCPDSTCEKSGYLDSHGDTAACVPAGTVVTIRGASSGEVDAVAG